MSLERPTPRTDAHAERMHRHEFDEELALTYQLARALERECDNTSFCGQLPESADTLRTQEPPPDFGEPWDTRPGSFVIRNRDDEICSGDRMRLRVITCVNACRGMADPAKEIAALRRLRWIPLTERMPTEDDANDSHDVEWSNSGDIWQAHFTDSERATHWRPITLP